MQSFGSEQHSSLRESDPVEAFQMATRLLVGIATQSLSQLDDEEVSIAQFRLLAVLDELGPIPSSKAAAALNLNASSVTRLADRMEAAEYVARTREAGNRSVVTLALTAEGTALVQQVVARRRAALTHLLNQLDPAEVASAAATLRRLVDVAVGDGTVVAHVPLAHLDVRP